MEGIVHSEEDHLDLDLRSEAEKNYINLALRLIKNTCYSISDDRAPEK
jgi:hypothetical protein